MGDGLYKIIRLAGAPFRFQISGMENIRVHNPAIFISNHVGSTGPIAITTSLPLHLYPWAVGAMMDFNRAAVYLYNDFIRPTWKLDGRFGMLVSYLVSRISVRLLMGLGAIPVDTSQGWSSEYFYKSLAYLKEGKDLLIFPENTKKAIDPQTGFHSFSSGFCWLGEMCRRATGGRLPIYPMAVNPQYRHIAIGKPVYFELTGNRREDMNDFRDRLYELVSGLYLSIKASHDEMVEKAFEWLEADDSDLKTGWIEKEDEIHLR
jgi:1-acyl-sn-glycerol-3-phosphate acyltransferase